MRALLVICGVALLAACAPEPGTKRWCEAQKEIPKGEWSANDAATYTQHCLMDGTEIDAEKQ